MATAAHVSHIRSDGQVTDLRLAEASSFALNGHPECFKQNCTDTACHGTKNHSGWPALKRRNDIVGAAAAIDVPQNYGICGQSGGWWSNNSWSADNGQEPFGASFVDEEVQQIAPAGFELQDDEHDQYSPPDAFVEEVLDEE